MYNGINYSIVVFLNLIIRCGIFEKGNEVAQVYLGPIVIYNLGECCTLILLLRMVPSELFYLNFRKYVIKYILKCTNICSVITFGVTKR